MVDVVDDGRVRIFGKDLVDPSFGPWNEIWVYNAALNTFAASMSGVNREIGIWREIIRAETYQEDHLKIWLRTGEIIQIKKSDTIQVRFVEPNNPPPNTHLTVIAEMPAHQLQIGSWYVEMAVGRPNPDFPLEFPWWRPIVDVAVYDKTGAVSEGVHIFNQVHIKYLDDDAIYTARYDEMVLVRGSRASYERFRKQENIVTDPIHTETYILSDVVKAFKLLELRHTDEENLAEKLRAAKAIRTGDIRETVVGRLSRTDYGKKIRRASLDRNEETFTHVREVVDSEDNPTGMYDVVLDGYIYVLPMNEKIFIDDRSIEDTTDV